MSVIYSDRDSEVRERSCPGCGLLLHFETAYPPIPLVVRRWYVPNDYERPIEVCPDCDAVLPD